MKQKVQEEIVATPYASALMFDKLPPFAKKILQLDGGFEMYDVVYDDEEQCQYLQRRANALKVVVNGNKGLNVDAEYESCSGKIGACIKYLRNYLDADDGYIGGGSLYFNDPNAVTDEEFTYFCQWMNKWLSSWINGVRQNRPLGKKLKIVDVKENDMLKGKPHNNHLDESQYSSLTKIEVYDIEFLDVGTDTDIASSKYKSVQIDVNIGKSLAMQIEKWFDLNVGIIPIAYKFKTIDTVKCKDYDDLKNENL